MQHEVGGMDYSPDLDLFARTELFQGTPPDALRFLQASAGRRRLAAGDILFQQGDRTTSLFVVIAGRLRASQMAQDGQQIIIRYLGPGEVAGYAALVGSDTHPGTVTAVDDSHLIGWTSAIVRQIMERYPVVAINALTLLGQRYHEMQIRVRELSTERVERRIGHTLLRLAHQSGRRTARGIEIAFPLSRRDLAEMVGTTLHTVSRTLSAWEERGIVSCGRCRVVLCKPHALVAIADEEE
ncbi:Crp/Fnr family transcriptional regulator [Bradyrhizobium sp. Arg237L]|uniref:Crp/Fnr family transcriptional regulator n=1 Tax=Bradyrhizobium sp. Arg237L TaxID=3003352 RepID=UPI00249F3405|nr:Crp/Fnr family transcriptional regulator [Bradyrhizobium sp. Arg237L]MDI4233221.1 Crp/Fnr family transcriptional regulator [Bradyrhizobium sp. Arg237L]